MLERFSEFELSFISTEAGSCAEHTVVNKNIINVMVAGFKGHKLMVDVKLWNGCDIIK